MFVTKNYFVSVGFLCTSSFLFSADERINNKTITKTDYEQNTRCYNECAQQCANISNELDLLKKEYSSAKREYERSIQEKLPEETVQRWQPIIEQYEKNIKTYEGLLLEACKLKERIVQIMQANIIYVSNEMPSL